MTVLCDMLMSAGAAPGGGRDVGGYEHGGVSLASRGSGTPHASWSE